MKPCFSFLIIATLFSMNFEDRVFSGELGFPADCIDQMIQQIKGTGISPASCHSDPKEANNVRVQMVAPLSFTTTNLKTWNNQILDAPKNMTQCTSIKEHQGVLLCQSTRNLDMNRALGRASSFIEGGWGLKPCVIPSIRNHKLRKESRAIEGHDLKSEDLLRFFSALKKLCDETGNPNYCPTVEEQALYDQVIVKQTGPFVLIAFSGKDKDWSSTLSHELLHAQYFLDPAYNAAIRSFWKYNLTASDRQTIIQKLAKEYDPSNEDLMINEFQAYLLEDGTPSKEFLPIITAFRQKLRDQLMNSGRSLLWNMPMER